MSGDIMWILQEVSLLTVQLAQNLRGRTQDLSRILAYGARSALGRRKTPLPLLPANDRHFIYVPWILTKQNQ